MEIQNYEELLLLLLSVRDTLRSQNYVYSAGLLNITLETMCLVWTHCDFKLKGSYMLTAGLFLH